MGLQPLTLHHSPRVLPSSHQLVPDFHLLRAADHGEGQMSLKQSQGQGLSAWRSPSEISLNLSSPSPRHRSFFHESLLGTYQSLILGVISTTNWGITTESGARPQHS